MTYAEIKEQQYRNFILKNLSSGSVTIINNYTGDSKEVNITNYSNRELERLVNSYPYPTFSIR